MSTLPTVKFALELTTLEEIRSYCKILAGTDLVPKAYKNKPDEIMIAGQMGARLGLDLFQSLQSIATINGNPSIYGDAGLAIVRSSNLLEDFDEWLEIDGQRVKEIPNLIDAEKQGKRIVQWCMSKRKGMKTPRVTTFSVQDAKTAHLWLKKGYNGGETPWCTSPARMLMFRARGFNLRDEFGDVLKGMKFFEEVQDYDLDLPPNPDGSYGAASVPSAPLPAPAPVAATPLATLLKEKAPVGQPTVETTPAEPPTAPPTDPPAPVDGGESLVPQIEATLAKLQKTAKGSALVNGLRKMFKLKGEEQFPAEATHHALYLKSLEGAVEKLDA